MPPKKFKPIDPSSLPKTISPIEKVPLELRTGHRREVDLTEAYKLSIEKHVDNLRYKIAFSANKVADELAHATSSKIKKDKEYIKGLVWSLGTLYDKLAGVAADTVTVRIPDKLLANVRIAIDMQMQRSASSQLRSSPQGAAPNGDTIDVTPNVVLPREDEAVTVDKVEAVEAVEVPLQSITENYVRSMTEEIVGSDDIVLKTT